MIVQSLSKKYKKAVASLEEAKASHQGLTGSLTARLVEQWTRMEEKAMEERGDALTVFDVVEQKGRILYFAFIVTVR